MNIVVFLHQIVTVDRYHTSEVVSNAISLFILTLRSPIMDNRAMVFLKELGQIVP